MITDDEGHSCREPGSRLQDYYCYAMPVLSPVRGQVARVVDELPDNHVGNVDSRRRFGNLVILYDPRGFYVELAHFQPHSIRVKPGEWVERGAVLGLCGNSGYSPQPHIHVQVQASDSPEAATLRFSFVGYQDDRQNYHANDLPSEGQRLGSMHVEQRLDELTTFLFDDVQEYEVLRRQRPAGRLRIRTVAADDGTCFFQTPRARLYFGKHEGTFYFYRLDGADPHLRLLLLALPRLPLAYQAGLKWQDYVPLSVATSGVRRFLARGASFFYPRLARVAVTQSFSGPNTVDTVVESKLLGLKVKASVELDPRSGFSALRMGNLDLQRISVSNGHAPSSPDPKPSHEGSNTVIASTMASVVLAIGALGAATADDSRAALRQSSEYEKSKDYPKAIEALLPTHAAHAQDYLLNERLGWLYYLSGRYDDAQRYYQEAVKARPQAIEAKLGCLLPMLAGERYREAEAIARDVLTVDPWSYYGNLRLAVALRGQKKVAEAMQVVQRMLVVYPADPYYRAERALFGRRPAAGQHPRRRPGHARRHARLLAA